MRLRLKSSGSLLWVIFHPRGHLAMSGDIFGLSQLNGECYRVDARDAARHPTMHRKTPHHRTLQSHMLIVVRLRSPALNGSLHPTDLRPKALHRLPHCVWCKQSWALSLGYIFQYVLILSVVIICLVSISFIRL